MTPARCSLLIALRTRRGRISNGRSSSSMSDGMSSAMKVRPLPSLRRLFSIFTSACSAVLTYVARMPVSISVSAISMAPPSVGAVQGRVRGIPRFWNRILCFTTFYLARQCQGSLAQRGAYRRRAQQVQHDAPPRQYQRLGFFHKSD